MSASAKLKLTEKLGYASGDVASCLYFGIFMSFIAIFYTDVYGLSPTVLAAMLLFARTWDWINDPIMGMIADRTNSKHGKYRSWILWMIIPYIVLGILTFTTFDLSPELKIVYAFVTYTLLMMVYTAINVPYGALMGVMTSDSSDRTDLAAFRQVGANVGIFAVTALLPFLVANIGGGNEQLGYSGALVIISLMAGGFFLLTFITCKERIVFQKQENLSIKAEVGKLLANWPWLILIAIAILTVVGLSFRSTTTLHYFKYVGGNEALGAQLLLLNSLIAMAAVLGAKYIVTFFGSKKKSYIALNLTLAVLFVWFYFIPADDLPLLIANQVCISIIAAPLMPIFWSMIANTADYALIKLDHSSTGVIFSAGTASMKIGWTIGPAIAMLLLGFVGYTANTAQTAATQQTLLLLMSIFPAALAVATAILTNFFPIGQELEKHLDKSMQEHAGENTDG